jgi:hypothetical protein
MVDLNIVIGPPIDIFWFKLYCRTAIQWCQEINRIQSMLKQIAPVSIRHM